MKNENTVALFVHLSAFFKFIGIPFGNIIGPLVLWLIFREQSEFVDKNGKEALNFQISFTIYMLICGILFFILIGFLLIIVVGIMWLIYTIMATVRASEGQVYPYPFTIHFIK